MSAPVSNAQELEDIEKKQIVVQYKEEEYHVGWYADLPPRDISEAVLCACDAIMDGGFVLRELDANGEELADKTYGFEQFGALESGKTYVMLPAEETAEVQKITGDRHRRLTVPIQPTLHVEAQKAIERMRRGSNLLKHTKYGLPHLRQFQLSEDWQRLLWYTSSKSKEESMVRLHEVGSLAIGQTTPTFLSYRLPMLEHLSFSLVCVDGTTLDITCKDHFEFDLWVTGLKALVTHHRGEQLSKKDLLAHSKRFRDALAAHNVSVQLTRLPEVKQQGEITLDDCIQLGTHSPAQLQAKADRFRKRLDVIRSQVGAQDEHERVPVESE